MDYGRLFLLSGAALFLLILGCIQSAPSPAPSNLFICPDGQTVVADKDTCPAVAEVAQSMRDRCEALDLPPLPDSTSAKEVCLYALAYKEGNVTLCNEISAMSYTYSPGNCGASIAAKKGDAHLCASIEDRTQRSTCYQRYVTDTEDYTACEGMEDKSTRNSCYYSGAGATGELSYCDKIVRGSLYDYTTKGACYAEVAKNFAGDFSSCIPLADTDRDDCYYAYATNWPYDPAACEPISKPSRKEDCLAIAGNSFPVNADYYADSLQ